MRHSYILLLLLLVFACDTEAPKKELAQNYLDAGTEALKANDIPKAVESFEIANYYAESTAMKEGIQYNQAYAYYYAADYDEAVLILNSLKENKNVLWLKGQCYRYLNKHQLALKNFKKAIEFTDLNTDPISYYSLWLGVGDAYTSLGNYNAAEKTFVQALEANLSPENNYLAYLNLGHLKIQTGKYPEAIAHLERARALNENAYVKVNLAEAYLKNGEQAKARSLTDEVLANPDITVRESDMAYMLKLEIDGVDVAYLKERLSKPDKSAEVTRLHAEKGMALAEVKRKTLEEQRAAHNKELLLMGLLGAGLISLIWVGYFAFRYYTRVRHMRNQISGVLTNLDRNPEDLI